MPLPEDPSGAFAAVESDVASVFSVPFPGGLEVIKPFESDLQIRSETTVVVPWRWVGVHEAPFLDVHPTGIQVAITGVTLLREDEHGELLHHRIVDWLTLYQKLGVVIGNRGVIVREDVPPQQAAEV